MGKDGGEWLRWETIRDSPVIKGIGSRASPFIRPSQGCLPQISPSGLSQG